MTHSTVPRRVRALALLGVASSTTLTGCFIDNKPPEAMLVNSRSTPVTLTVGGIDHEPQEVPARLGIPVYGTSGKPITGRGVCEGDGFIVTDTATGTVLGTSDEPVCGETVIRVKEDGTVTR